MRSVILLLAVLLEVIPELAELKLCRHAVWQMGLEIWQWPEAFIT